MYTVSVDPSLDNNILSSITGQHILSSSGSYMKFDNIYRMNKIVPEIHSHCNS
jgi:hypothetical protein